MTPIEQVRDEGNCGEVTNRGEEACECAGKLTKNRRQPHADDFVIYVRSERCAERMFASVRYFGLAQQFDDFVNLDGWIRRRIRMCYWKQWRRPRTKVRNLVRLGVNLDMAIKHAISRKSYWRLSRTPAMRYAMPNRWLEQLGLLSLKQLGCDLVPLRGTA